MTLYNQLTINRRAENAARLRENALRAHERVGGNGASLKANSEVTKVNRRAENAARLRDNQKDVASGMKIQGEPTGQTGQGGRPLGDTTSRNTTAKSGGGWSTDKTLAVAGGLQDIFKGLGQAFDEGDIISMGSGYQGERYNPEMYIGQGLGY